MKLLGIAATICLATLLTSCASTSTQQPIDLVTGQPDNTVAPTPCPKSKNPMNVSILPKGTTPTRNYKILGSESVSKYNTVGVKKQEANIKDTLRKMAAAMGGDAIIDLKYDKKEVIGTVITYEDKPDQDSVA